MSDTDCIVCNVSWDDYNARHGDLTKWEFEVFIKGGPCPSCERRAANKPSEPTKLAPIEFGDVDE